MKIPIISNQLEQRDINRFLEKINLDRLYDRALISYGDSARLYSLFKKANNRETVTIGAIGGSITEGALATKKEWRWINLVLDWWKEKFPATKINLVNAGLSATGSLYGAHRIKDDLLRFNPDLVVIEFSANDRNDQLSAESLEGLVRQALYHNNKPAVLLLFMGSEFGFNAQEWHRQVGKHYQLPMISYSDAVIPMIESGILRKERISSDGIHPNNHGHHLCAMIFKEYLTNQLGIYSWPTTKPVIYVTPDPLFTDTFEFTTRYNAVTLIPELNIGWRKSESRWISDEPGSQLVQNIPGDCISIVYKKKIGDMGMIDVSIDQNKPIRLDGWFKHSWGSYPHTQIIARGLGSSVHQVRIRLLEDKAELSKGHHFEIIELLSAGKIDSQISRQ